ncbi:hypothetical protein ABZ128_08450 [Streptomyces sp. NPDC006326]|uniref:hypothetical protein n=1 Tax=Streptomyces sp. NPDC006326 TaxID=3156752 RepID=UPI0033B62622
MACRRLLRFVVGATTAGLLLSACSSGQSAQEAASLPERVCWGAGVFESDDVAPLVGQGKRVRDDSPAMFELSQDNKRTSCTLFLDGDIRFHARAWRLAAGQDFFWDTQQEQHPDKLSFGKKGLVWDGGAVVALTCRRSDETFELELSLDDGSGAGKPRNPRQLFTGLMKHYYDFATEQLRCAA